MKKLLIMKNLIILLVISWITYAGYEFIIKKDTPNNTSHKVISQSNAWKNDIMNVWVVNPTVVGSWDILESSYLWEVLSAENWSVFAYRSWIIEKFLVDVGSEIKKWQVLARMIPAEFNPDLANMVSEKKTMRIKALAMVESAQLTLDSAIERKNQIIKTNEIMIHSSNESLVSSQNIKSRVGESTQKQLDSTLLEQEAKIKKIQSDIDFINTKIKNQEQKIINMTSKTEAWIDLETSKLKIYAWNIKTSIKSAYNTLNRVFYASNYNEYQGSSNFNGNIYFWAKNSTYTNLFTSLFSQIHQKHKNIDNLSQEEIFSLAKDMIEAIDLWIKVLDNTITSYDYSDSMLNDDKKMLIMAKTDSMNGIQTNLNMYNEQLSMLQKEKNMAWADVSDEKLMYDELLSEKKVMEKDLEMAIAEKDRMIAETQNMKTMADNEAIKMETETSRMLAWDIASAQMSLIEADKMITEGQKMLIDAKADLESANYGLSLLETAWFSNEIKAQFSGKITKRYVNIWDAIDMSTPVFDIVDGKKEKESNIFVRFEIPESEFNSVSLWQEISFFKTIEPEKKYSANIQRISPAINKTTKWVIVEAIVNGKQDEKILIWSSIRVNIKSTHPLYTIPVKTIKQDENGDTYVLKVLKNKVEKQIVKTGRVYGENIFVTEWLKIWTKIIVEDGGMNLEVWLPVKYTFVNTIKLDANPENWLIDEHAAMWHGSHKK